MAPPDLRALVFRPPTPAPHANDGERYEARYRIEGEEQLHRLMDALGITVRAMTEAERAGPQTALTPSPIPDFEHLAQPNRVQVAGIDVQVWFGAGFFDVTLVGARDPYVLDEDDLERARRLDSALVSNEVEAARID